MRNFALHGILLAVAGFATAASVLADVPQIRATSQEIAAMPTVKPGAGTSGVASMRTTVLVGDPNRPGLYTIQIFVPPHTQIQPHHHRDDRSATVISGTWYIGYGERHDAAALKALPPGGFYTEPAGTAHFAATKDEAVVVRITGYGPTDTVYVNTADDPTHAAH
jgi:quercetin dioxygenase-like cupin family protein